MTKFTNCLFICTGRLGLWLVCCTGVDCGLPSACVYVSKTSILATGMVEVRDGKGAKDRVTMLPVKLAEPLQRHLRKVKAVHEEDLEAGFGAIHLPDALVRKYPNAAREWPWQWET